MMNFSRSDVELFRDILSLCGIETKIIDKGDHKLVLPEKKINPVMWQLYFDESTGITGLFMRGSVSRFERTFKDVTPELTE